MKKRALVICGIFLCLAAQNVLAHCEVPCGIYDDGMRIKMIREHILTIEKSMKMIAKLSSAPEKNYNQIVRWINNKEHHANELQHIVAQYFMTQRVKPVDKEDVEAYEEYINKLTLLHQMMFYAMKSKQTADFANVEMLRSLLNSFRDAYFGSEGHSH